MPTVLITGASRGLGFEFANQYAAEGWRVIACCRKPEDAIGLENLAPSARDMVSVVAMDVADNDTVRNAASNAQGCRCRRPHQQRRHCRSPGQSTGQIDYASWARVLDVNTMGPLRVLEAFTDNLARSERRLAVTITSGMGSLADNTSGGSIAYRSSKAAVNMVMRSAAIDLAPRRITCVLIDPGWVKTDMGGPDATLSPQQSVSAMRRLIEKLGPDDLGKFYNYDGREYPW